MTTILHIDSSPNISQSGSRLLTREFVAAYVHDFRESVVVYRDLATQRPALVDEQWVAANFTPPELRTPEMHAVLGPSDALIDELLAAELLVIGAPMHNFGISTLLKSYIDQVVRVGRTFQFTPEGPRGLIPNKRVVVFTTRGSDYSGPMAAFDFQEPYLRTLFSFLGMTDVTCVNCNGMDMGNREQALDVARQTIVTLVANTRGMPIVPHLEQALAG
jgi:FMN-dependent NADH-azoreductase